MHFSFIHIHLSALFVVIFYDLAMSLHPGQAIDSDLSETGLQQADAAGRYLRDVIFSNVFVSDMLRARQVRRFTLPVGVNCESRRRKVNESTAGIILLRKCSTLFHSLMSLLFAISV